MKIVHSLVIPFAILLLSGLTVAIVLVFIPLSPMSDEDHLLKINSGDGLLFISDKLDQEELIRSKIPFVLYTAALGHAGELKAGTYRLSPSMSIANISKILFRGEIETIKVTIPEGFNMLEIDEILSQSLGREIHVSSHPAGSYLEEFSFLPQDSLEGYLFPDTYHISLEESEEEIIRAMLRNFEDRAGDEVAKDVLIMASLLEKELIDEEEMRIASGVLWKRLSIGMAL